MVVGPVPSPGAFFNSLLGVVAIHGYRLRVALGRTSFEASESWGCWGYPLSFFSQGVGKSVIPMLFAISGYLFFCNYRGEFAVYKRKILSRVQTLLVPYAVWNVLVLLAYWPLQRGSSGTALLSGGHKPIAEMTAFELTRQVFAFPGMPVAYQFWYIADLFVVLLFAPLLFLLLGLSRLAAAALVFLAFVWAAGCDGPIGAFCFVSLGACLALHGVDLGVLRGRKGIVLALWVASIVLYLSQRHPLTACLCQVCGVCGWWVLPDHLSVWPRLVRFIAWATPSSFMIFALHEPAFTLLIKVGAKVASPMSGITWVAILYASMILVMLLSIATSKVLAKIVPGLLRVLTGGRGG
jgi:surface polysaccharide O-acyltransferase-like enzyme